METQYSILLYQAKGYNVDWHTEDYYGPFTSKEEREEWLGKPENQLDELDRARYVVAFLSK